MMPASVSSDDTERLLAQVRQAVRERSPLRIRGGDTKAGLGRAIDAPEIDTREHRGIVRYDPSELVVTVRAGTPLASLEETLAQAGQMLPCESPLFDARATVGGTVASGLAGPRRPWSGSVRDYVLGCRVMTGDGQHMRFGGEVMKNVAGYDVSRLLAGSFGCLGLLTEVSLKVLPMPRACAGVRLEIDTAEALRRLARWRRQALPVSGACHLDGHLHVRFEGGESSVASAVEQSGGEDLDPAFWNRLRERQLPFFDSPLPLWRIALPSSAMPVAWPGDVLLDWGGAQPWLKSDAPPARIRELAEAAGGHAICHTRLTDSGVEPLHPLPAVLLRYHQQLKRRMDPHGIFNPGRMYADL